MKVVFVLVAVLFTQAGNAQDDRGQAVRAKFEKLNSCARSMFMELQPRERRRFSMAIRAIARVMGRCAYQQDPARCEESMSRHPAFRRMKAHMDKLKECIEGGAETSPMPMESSPMPMDSSPMPMESSPMPAESSPVPETTPMAEAIAKRSDGSNPATSKERDGEWECEEFYGKFNKDVKKAMDEVKECMGGDAGTTESTGEPSEETSPMPETSTAVMEAIVKRHASRRDMVNALKETLKKIAECYKQEMSGAKGIEERNYARGAYNTGSSAVKRCYSQDDKDSCVQKHMDEKKEAYQKHSERTNNPTRKRWDAGYIASIGKMLACAFGGGSAPTSAEPTTKEPTTEAVTTAEPTTESVTTEESTTESVTTEEPTTEADGTTESATTAEPTTESATTEEPTTESATSEEPTTESATTAKPTTESATTEEPTTESATSEEPTTESITTEQPTTGASDMPTSEQPTTGGSEMPPSEQPTTGASDMPTSEEPTTGASDMPTSEQPTTGGSDTPTSEQPTTEASDMATSEQPITEASGMPTSEMPTTEGTEMPTSGASGEPMSTTEQPSTTMGFPHFR